MGVPPPRLPPRVFFPRVCACLDFLCFVFAEVATLQLPLLTLPFLNSRAFALSFCWRLCGFAAAACL